MVCKSCDDESKKVSEFIKSDKFKYFVFKDVEMIEDKSKVIPMTVEESKDPYTFNQDVRWFESREAETHTKRKSRTLVQDYVKKFTKQQRAKIIEDYDEMTLNGVLPECELRMFATELNSMSAGGGAMLWVVPLVLEVLQAEYYNK